MMEGNNVTLRPGQVVPKGCLVVVNGVVGRHSHFNHMRGRVMRYKADPEGGKPYIVRIDQTGEGLPLPLSNMFVTTWGGAGVLALDNWCCVTFYIPAPQKSDAERYMASQPELVVDPNVDPAAIGDSDADYEELNMRGVRAMVMPSYQEARALRAFPTHLGVEMQALRDLALPKIEAADTEVAYLSMADIHAAGYTEDAIKSAGRRLHAVGGLALMQGAYSAHRNVLTNLGITKRREVWSPLLGAKMLSYIIEVGWEGIGDWRN